METTNPRDQLIELLMQNRLSTSSMDTTGAAMADRAADLMVLEYGSLEAALLAAKLQSYVIQKYNADREETLRGVREILGMDKP